MRARWVSHRPSPKLPIVGQAQVASWWPWRYYFVSTIQVDQSSPLSKLARSLQMGVSFQDVPPGPDVFVTQVFKCSKDLCVKSFDNPLFEREYSELSQAQRGHEEVVNLLVQGKLKLSL